MRRPHVKIPLMFGAVLILIIVLSIGASASEPRTAPTSPGAVLEDVLINEVDADQVSTDSAEFVELYDGGAGNTDLTGSVLVLFNGSDDASYQAFDLDGQSTDANGYFVLCGDAANVANCDLDVSPDTNLIQNGADAAALYLGDAVDFPEDTPVSTTNLLDAIVYDTDDGDDAGLLVLLNAGQPQVNERDGGDGTAHSNQRCPNGTGGARNTDTYAQFDPTPGAINTCGLLINEVDADQVSTDSAEFVELYDGGAGNTDLTGSVLVLFNGSDDASYQAFDLDGQSTDANGYFVLCGDAANVANCDLDVSPDTNLIQNGADAVALFLGDAVDFPEDTPVSTTNLMDAIVYDTDDGDDAGLLVLLNAGQPQVNERDGGDGTAHSNQRCPNGGGGARNTDTYTQDTPSPGTENACAPPPVENCGDPFTPIFDIQGNGDASPIVGTEVSTEGVVTGDFQAGDELDGFFVQDELGDGDTATSDGIFIHVPGGLDVSIDDLVRVHGTVQENYGETRLASVNFLTMCNPPASTASTASVEAVAPVELNLPVTAQSEFEPYEGMLVTFPADLTVTEHYNQGRYGEVWVSSDGQLFNPTHVADPGAPAQAVGASNDLRRLLIDDGSNISDPPIVSYIGLDDTLRLGDTATGLTGTLGYGFSNYRLQPTIPPVFVRTNPRHSAPADVGGTLRVASFNVLNYFTTIADGSNDARGANSASEFTRQRDKIINAILKVDADVVGLMEIENNGYGAGSAIQDLVDGLNAIAGGGTYDFIDPGVSAIGTDAIAVGFLYKPASVTPVGGAAILDSSVDPQFDDTKNRPALAQTFMENASGNMFTPIVNHLKSKGSSCGAGDDDTTTDGQGNCNLTRTNAAVALANWLTTDPTGSGDPDYLIIGDLNAYAKEDPIEALKNAGYVDLANSYLGMYAYSYVFDGEVGYLDYAMANASIQAQVTGTTIWDINSDEPRVLDYNDDILDPGESYINPGAYLYGPHPNRASDHDPIIVGLNLRAEEVWRFRGYAYQGLPRDISTPLGGVTLTLYGRNAGEAEPGSWMKTTITSSDGFFNFHIIPPYDYEYFTLVAMSPSGMVATGAWSEDGTVVGFDTVKWTDPAPGVHANEFYFDIPTPTPTPTDTPTPTPTPTDTPTPTPTATPTETPTPTITPTSTPIIFNLWLPMILTPEEEGPFQLTILHTNDFHAHVEEYNADGSSCDAGDTCLGGSPRLKTKIDEIRSTKDNVLLLDAGDEFQGTLYYGLFKSEVIASMMNAIGYDVMTVGNHEFDDGPDELARFINEVNFPLISANIDVSAEPSLAGKIAPSVIIAVDGEEIGIVGAITTDTAIISSPGPNIIFNDVATSTQMAVDALTDQGVDKIIALTHQGYNEDVNLAQTITGLDVIVGGHSHTFTYWPTDPVRFEPPTFPRYSDITPAGPYPTMATAPDGNPTLVVTAYQWGTFLGNLNVVFDPDGVVESYDGDPVFLANTIAQDAGVETLLDPYRDAVNDLRKQIIAESNVDMPIDEGGEEICRTGECLLGSLIADSMLWKVNSIIVDPADQYQIALQNGGGLRAPIVAGPISRGAVLETLPFGNTIATFGLTGAHMIEALENGVSRVGGTSGTGRFPQVSGIRYTYDPTAEVGSRIVSVELHNADGSYSPLDPTTVYKVVTNDFMRTGGDGYSVLNDFAIDPYDFGPALDEAAAEYMTLISPIEAGDIQGGRIIRLP